MNDRLRATLSVAGLHRYYFLSLLLVCIPLPFLLGLQYLGGEIRSCVPMFFSWLALGVVYWWPVGTLLFLWKRGWVSRLLIGYLISLPLYFLYLFLIYPALNGHFHPSSPTIWGIYFSQTPVYFLFVTCLFLLTRNGQTLRRIASWLVAAAFAAGATGIEHVASIESLPDDLVSLLVQKGTFVDPTFGYINYPTVVSDHPAF